MENIVFEKQVMAQLNNLSNVIYEMRNDISLMKNKFEDYFLSEYDKKTIDVLLKEEKEGKLATKSEVFS